MGMLYLCSIKKQRTKHRSAMHQGANANAPRCALGRPKMQNIKYKIQNIKYNPATFGQKSADWSDDDGNDEP